MGKSNRIRNAKASATIAGVKTPAKKQGMPSWALNLITILIAAVILFSVAFSLLTANGVFTRMQTAVKSDNFRVNANMMTYYFKTQYSSFVSENSSYLSYYGLDTSISLKDQYVDTNDESQGTWFDYMMDQTQAQVEEILRYCEEAETRKIELDDSDWEKIDSELEMYKTYADMYGYSTNAYVANIFGKGMKLKDIKDALELSTLASKCSEVIGEELEGEIGDDDITAEYDDNKLDYDLVDYTYYTFDVTYKDAAEAVLGKDDYTDEEAEEKESEIVAKYKEMIADAKAKAEALAAIKDKAEFSKKIAEYIVTDEYDNTYEDAIKDSSVADDKLPDETVTATIREKLIAHILDLIVNDKDFDADAIVKDGKVLGEVEVDETYATEIKTIAETIYTAAVKANDATVVEGANYTDTDDAIEWAFEEGRKAGDTDTFESGDGADDAEISDDAAELESASVSVYYVDKIQYRNEKLTKNIGIMMFSSTEDAATAIEKLSEGMTIEEFEEICDELGGTFNKYENYTKGSMGVSAFDTWLYGDDVEVGSYTDAAITVEETQFMVALYYEDGEAEWHVSVKSAIFTEKYTEFNTDLQEKYTVEVKEKVLAKIDA